MMELYIQIRNGQPFEHPIFGDNFRQAFPDVDVNNLPPKFAKFERVSQNVMPDVFEIVEVRYEWFDDIVKDVWHIRDMSADEKAAKQQKIKDAFNNRPQASNWSAWVFNEETCIMEPPIPRPNPVPGKIVFWCGADNNWKEAPPRPTDGSNYQFDFFAWQWVVA